jgi:hypothetical protein
MFAFTPFTEPSIKHILIKVLVIWAYNIIENVTYSSVHSVSYQ